MNLLRHDARRKHAAPRCTDTCIRTQVRGRILQAASPARGNCLDMPSPNKRQMKNSPIALRPPRHNLPRYIALRTIPSENLAGRHAHNELFHSHCAGRSICTEIPSWPDVALEVPGVGRKEPRTYGSNICRRHHQPVAGTSAPTCWPPSRNHHLPPPS